MPRIPLISPESELTPEQRRVVDGILGKRGGRIPAPYRLSLHCPELTEAWHPLGERLHLKSRFPLRFSELAIAVTARAWDCDYVFQAHAPIAVKAGLPQSIVDAMVCGERPVFENPDEEALYDFSMELFARHAVSDKTYKRVLDLFGVPGVVELTALIGYYSMVTMTLLAHDMPLPPDTKLKLTPRH
jgi:4-carboxymuconolactone decarboxylase